MAVEIDKDAVVAAAEEILRESDTRGFAWAPWIDIKRYGIKNGLIMPLLDHIGPISHLPPIVPDAPEAGREDFQAVLRRSRPDQK